MGITINKKDLASRAVRSFFSQDGLKTIDATRTLGRQEEDGFISNLLKKSIQLIGFASNALNAILGILSFTFTGAIEWLLERTEAIKAFDWNASDKELQEIIDGQTVAVAGIWGSLVGQGLGWLAGIGVGYGIGMLCPVIGSATLAKSIAANVGKEAIEELKFGLLAAMRVTVNAWASSQLINGYINFRKVIKNTDRDRLKEFFGDDAADFIKDKWGADDGPSYTFNEFVDTNVEKISNKALRAFVENLLEDSWDSFIEAGFIIGAELDAAYLQSRAAGKNQLGAKRVVDLVPDRNIPEERIRIEAPEKLAQGQIQDYLTQHRMIGHRDIGQLVGQPVDDYVRAQPHRRKLTVQFRSKEKPPFTVVEDGQRVRAKVATYTIPEAKIGLNWQELKLAAKQFTWGRFRCTANLSNGRQMAVYGNTGAEAERKLRELLTLSTAEILTLSVSEEGQRHPSLKKQARIMYPHSAVLLVRRETNDAPNFTDQSGQGFQQTSVTIELWPEEEPPDSPLLL